MGREWEITVTIRVNITVQKMFLEGWTLRLTETHRETPGPVTAPG